MSSFVHLPPARTVEYYGPILKFTSLRGGAGIPATLEGTDSPCQLLAVIEKNRCRESIGSVAVRFVPVTVA